MDWFTITFWLLLGLVSAVYYYFQRKFSYWKERGVKYLEPTIPFGNLSHQSTGNFKGLFEKVYALRDGSPFVGCYFATKPVVVATDLNFVQDVLVKDFNSFHGRGIFTNEKVDPLSAHLFSLDGPKWKWLRSKLSPTFTSGKMKFMFPTIVEVSERFNETLNVLLEKDNVFDVKELSARFTTDVIGTCAFGIECNSLKDPDTEFRKYGRLFFEKPLTGILRRITMQYPQLAKLFKLRLMRKDVTDFFLGIVRQTVDHRERNNIRRNDFMDMLIDLKNNNNLDEDDQMSMKKLTFEQVAAQAFVFFIAGFETSSTTMMFCLYELSLNPDLQEAVRVEINTVLQKYNGRLIYEAVKDMKFLDQVINETLRKYPPVVVLRRKAEANYKVANTNCVIEKETPIIIPAYAIHHDPDHYPNPGKFDPDRFTPEMIKSRHAMSFLGFGDGPRNCIGLRFGRMQAHIGLTMLLKNYRFAVSKKTPIPMVFSDKSPVLSPVAGISLKIEKV